MAGAGLAMAAPLVARFAHAAEVTWRFGHVAPVSSPLHQRLLEAADAIAKRSDGKMALKVIGEGQAGIQSGLLAQVRGGGLEMTVASGMHLAPVVPLAGIPAIGFLFNDYASVWRDMDGDVGGLIRTQIAAQPGLEVFDKVWDFGFRHITTSDRPIQSAADLSGLKIRTQIDAEQMDMFQALSAVPVVVTLPYLRTAFQHRQLDGQEGMLQLVQYTRLNEVQNYCAMTRHAWDGLWLCANSAAWRKLPERLQRVVANTLNGTATRQRDDSAKAESTTRDQLTKAGMTFSDVDFASFRNMLHGRGYYARIRGKLGEANWTVVQRAAGIKA